MNPLLKNLWKVVRNKYFVVTAVFLVLFFFLDDNNFFVAQRLHRQVSQLEAQAEELRQGIDSDSAQANALRYDRAAIERFGREEYYMKRADEDIFIIK